MISKIFAVATTLVLIRGMTQEDYSFYITFSTVATLFVSIVSAGINKALVRFSAEYFSSTGKKPFRLYLLSLMSQLVIFFFLVIITFVFPNETSNVLLGKPELSFILPISMVFGLGSILLFSGQSMLQAEERFSVYVRTLWIKQVLMLLAVVGLLLINSLSFRWVAWFVTIVQLIIGFGVAVYSIAGFKKVNWQPIQEQEKNLVKQFLSASGWLIGYYVTLSLFIRMDVLMLTRFSTNTELATYGVAFQYYSMALVLLGSISAVLAPKFSRIEMQDRDRQRQFVGQWLRYTVWIGVPVVIFIVFGKPVFIFLNGIQYEHSFTILRILSIGVWLSLMLSPLTNILLSRKEFKFLFQMAVIAFISSLILFSLGVKLFGGIGAAIAVILVHNFVLQIPILIKILRY